MKKSENTDADHLLFSFSNCISLQVRISAKNFWKSFAYFVPKEHQKLTVHHFHFVLKLKRATEVHNNLYWPHGLG